MAGSTLLQAAPSRSCHRAESLVLTLTKLNEIELIGYEELQPVPVRDSEVASKKLELETTGRRSSKLRVRL
jgi:hypothetical protein